MNVVLPALSWTMIVVFMVLIMRKKLSPFVVLIVVPLVFTLMGSFLGLYEAQAAEVFKTATPTILD